MHQFSSVPLQFVPKSCGQSVIVTQSQPLNTQSSIIKTLVDEPVEEHSKDKQESAKYQTVNGKYYCLSLKNTLFLFV